MFNEKGGPRPMSDEFEKQRDAWVKQNEDRLVKEYMDGNGGPYYLAREISKEISDWSRAWTLKHDLVVRQLVEALVWSEEMLVARDSMNSKIHCAPVRLSPITERAQQALAAYKKAIGEDE
jgi:hypothetical protein